MKNDNIDKLIVLLGQIETLKSVMDMEEYEKTFAKLYWQTSLNLSSFNLALAISRLKELRDENNATAQ